MGSYACIKAIAGYLPEKVETNDGGDRFIKKIGENRYFANFLDSRINPGFCAYIFDSLSNIVAKVPTPKIEIPKSIGSSQPTTNNQEKVLILYFYMFQNQPRINISSLGYILSIKDDNTVDTLYKINLGEYRITKPDTDNLNKLLKDCMTEVCFWKDDSLVASEIIEKFWADKPGIYIKIEELL